MTDRNHFDVLAVNQATGETMYVEHADTLAEAWERAKRIEGGGDRAVVRVVAVVYRTGDGNE